MEEKKSGKKLRYTILFVPNNAHKVKQFHISFDGILCLSALCFAFLIAVVTYVSYSASHIDELKATIVAKETVNKDLSDQNILLQANVEELTTTLHDAKVVIDAKDTAKEQKEKEESKQYIPNGFPIDGAVALPSNYTEETHYVVFQTGFGTKIVASADGTVSYVGVDAELGNVVKIDHGNGYVSVYMNPSEPVVSEGDKVIRGSTLFTVKADDETLTYQILFNEQYIDPMTVIEING